MAGLGFEPRKVKTDGFTVRSNRPLWHPAIFKNLMVGGNGFEPLTQGASVLRSTIGATLPSLGKLLGGGGRNRTADTEIFSLLLYQLSYPTTVENVFDYRKVIVFLI